MEEQGGVDDEGRNQTSGLGREDDRNECQGGLTGVQMDLGEHNIYECSTMEQSVVKAVMWLVATADTKNLDSITTKHFKSGAHEFWRVRRTPNGVSFRI